MGTPEDLAIRAQSFRVDDSERQSRIKEARAKIFEGGLAVANTGVDNITKGDSLQPVLVRHFEACTTVHIERFRRTELTSTLFQNAFSKPKLFAAGVDIFSALVVDLMHEFEQGVWKDLFLHLLRILEASGPGESLNHALDQRYVAKLLLLLPTLVLTVSRLSPDIGSLQLLERRFAASSLTFLNRNRRQPETTKIYYR